MADMLFDGDLRTMTPSGVPWAPHQSFHRRSNVGRSTRVSGTSAFMAYARVPTTMATATTTPGHGESWKAPRMAASPTTASRNAPTRSEEHTSELQSRQYLVCRLLLEKKKRH